VNSSPDEACCILDSLSVRLAAYEDVFFRDKMNAPVDWKQTDLICAKGQAFKNCRGTLVDAKGRAINRLRELTMRTLIICSNWKNKMKRSFRKKRKKIMRMLKTHNQAE
jgi:hypothetical protein